MVCLVTRCEEGSDHVKRLLLLKTALSYPIVHRARQCREPSSLKHSCSVGSTSAGKLFGFEFAKWCNRNPLLGGRSLATSQALELGAAEPIAWETMRDYTINTAWPKAFLQKSLRGVCFHTTWPKWLHENELRKLELLQSGYPTIFCTCPWSKEKECGFMSHQ
jgi:hypothetical protein